jgi:hypothetical protein
MRISFARLVDGPVQTLNNKKRKILTQMVPKKQTAPCHMDKTIHFQNTRKLKYAAFCPAL